MPLLTGAVAVAVAAAVTFPTAEPVVIPLPVSPATANGLGVYSGPGEVGETNNFSSWLNRPVEATDYLDPAWTKWNPQALKRWGDWKNAKPGLKFTLGLHLVPEKGGSLTAGLRGAYDWHFRVLAQQLVSNGLGDSVIRLGYEPNNPNIGPWQGTSNPDGYKAMYRRAHGILRSVAPNLKFDYNLAVGTSGKVISFWTLYPGSAYVDIVGLNIYDVWWAHYGATPWQRWNHTLTTKIGVNDHKAFAKYVGKPVSYPEWGLYKKGDFYAGGGDSTFFIDRMAELVKGAKYHAYFDLNWTNHGSKIDMFPQAKARYKERFGG
ncbi:hypothetical protein [Streptomyces sp. NPDC126514]|uniref:hypothetical protein n=1 Tax=Streptomyces sp. NPDC126514 TaxID=3155210 RepID=UPI00332736CF